MPPSASATGLHWQVAQATSLFNVVVHMSTEPENNHQGAYFVSVVSDMFLMSFGFTGIFMENGRSVIFYSIVRGNVVDLAFIQRWIHER
jgi:hypothetical protein